MCCAKTIKLSDAASVDEVRTGDLLLFRGAGRVARLIQVAGRSEYSHAGMVVWWRDKPMCVEVREWYGGRAVTLASLVKKYPGRIDLFRTNPGGHWDDFEPDTAAGVMIDFAGQPYGWASVLAAATLHLPFVRCLVAPRRKKRFVVNSSKPPFCSQAVAMACKAGGVDPVPELADRLTEPGDLARSPFFKKRFTFA